MKVVENGVTNFYGIYKPDKVTQKPIGGDGNVQTSTSINVATQSSEDVAKRLGLRSADGFGAGYDRVAKVALTRIFQTHSSVESFVKQQFGELLSSGQAGLGVKYQELMVNARTVDAIMRNYKGSNPDDLYTDYALELNVSQIARYYYARTSGNHVGAQHISGLEQGLLPTEALTPPSAL